MWIWLVLLYGVLKGAREICKKKALLTCSSIEVLLIYTILAFLMVCPDIGNVWGMAPKMYFFVALKSFVIFIAWICSFKAIKGMPISLYGVLDLSRVLFTTLLGITVLGERMGVLKMVGLILVCAGLLMLKLIPAALEKNNKSVEKEAVSFGIVVIALISCMLNSVSALFDKVLTGYISSSQLQFWYMLFLCIYYIIYAIVDRSQIDIKKAVKNKWIWLLALMFIIADRALFVANSMQESQMTVMTLLKQAGCIVTILAGRYIFKEKNTGYKLLCAAVVIFGIILSSISTIG